MIRKIITGVIVIVVGFFAYDFFLKTPNFNSGAKAPDFQTSLITGEDFSLSDLKGDYVLLDFWGSWCGPCLKEIPALVELYEDYHDRSFKDADNFHIVSIALEKSDKQTRKIIESRGLDWDHHIIDVSRVVLMSSLAQAYDVKELPTKFLINPNGEIMGTNLSMKETRRILDGRLN